MKREFKYISVISLLCTLVAVMSCKKKSNSEEIIIKVPSVVIEDTSVPGVMKKLFTTNGAFKAPKFSFTTDYNSSNTANLSTQKGLFFTGLPYKGKATKVFCWYGLPAGGTAGKKYPAVVLVHGGGGTVFPDWVKKWTDKGYIAISVALEGQVPGDKLINVKQGELVWPTIAESGPYRPAIFFSDLASEKTEDTWFYHALADVMLANSLLRTFPEVDSNNIGITGISWGGIITNVVTGIDDRFKFAIPVYGCGFLNETPVYSTQLLRLSTTAQKLYKDNWDPSLYIPKHKQPTLFINGSNDLHFTLNAHTKSFALSTADKYLRIEKEMIHGHVPGWTPEEIYDFANYVVLNSIKLVKFSYAEKTNNQVKFNYDGIISTAKIYFTTDTVDWSAEAFDSGRYVWSEETATVNNSQYTITADIPANAQCFFVNGILANKRFYSSQMVKNK